MEIPQTESLLFLHTLNIEFNKQWNCQPNHPSRSFMTIKDAGDSENTFQKWKDQEQRNSEIQQERKDPLLAFHV